jgi:triosephosphate isomerase
MLKDVGIKWVVLGHSERRSVFGESDKVFKTIITLLIIILCIVFLLFETIEKMRNLLIYFQKQVLSEKLVAAQAENLNIVYCIGKIFRLN